MSIIIEPLGGLGNQLFIYALGLRLAQENRVDLVCDTWNFHNYSWHEYELDTIPNSISETYSSRSRELFGHKSRSLIRKSQALHLLPRRFGRLILESGSAFDPAILNSSSRSRLNGYFQSLKYFAPVADQVRAQVRHPLSPSEWMNRTRQNLRSLGKWTAVHVRRGNYTSLPIMGLAQEDYYVRAIDLMDRTIGPRPLVFFSDSPEVLPNISECFSDRVQIIETPRDVRAIDTLQLMSDASSFVIANSTFSWWAAFLAGQEECMVVAPRPWLDDPAFNDRDLLLPNWVTVGRK
jgi:hypothetical protein